MFIVAVLVFPQSVVYPNIKSKKTDAIQNNNKNVLLFTLRRRTVDSAQEKLKGKFLKNTDFY